MTGRLVTVFGGSGFVGRHLVKRLAARGYRVRVAVRDPESAAFLQTMGEVGQIAAVRANIRDDASVRRAVEGADVVVNLVGILYAAGAQKFDAVHVAGAERVARAAKEAGAATLVHMSALGADADSPSEYARTKAAGEAAARAAYPEAIVVRPSIVFGAEDNFFNRFGAMAVVSPFLPLIGGGVTRFQPIWVHDLAEAMVRMIETPAAAGRTYELAGPEVLTFRQLMELVLKVTGRRCLLLPIPFPLARLQGLFLQMLPKPLLTVDQVRLLERDNVPSGDAPGLADLGIEGTPPRDVLDSYMARYRRGEPQAVAGLQG